MKKPEYKIGDYVEVETCIGNRKGFIVRFVNLKFGSGNFVTIKNRRNDVFTVESNCIIRKLPILRDKSGRFVGKKVKLNTIGEPFTYEEKSCSCYNCDKCVEQMRAYYEKSGELKPKLGKNWGKIRDSEGNYHEFGTWETHTLETPRNYKGSITTKNNDTCSTKEGWEYHGKDCSCKKSNIKTEEKKPSERIMDLIKKDRLGLTSIYSPFNTLILEVQSIIDYLDECWEKGK